ncbi:MAG: P1 family peptidase [Pseudomonadota bacterium]
MSRLAMTPGPRNSITDVAGLLVGNAEDHEIKTGVTVVTAEAPFVAAVNVMGGAPGTRDTDALAPDRLVQEVHALVLSGGSVFGLDACGGVASGLRAQGKGLLFHDQVVPVTPGAILFDLVNGGRKDWDENPYPALGRAAVDQAGESFEIGASGAGTGALIAGLKGGLGSASLTLESGYSVGALVAVNAVGSVVVGDGPHFWAAPFEFDAEFGGLGPAPSPDPTQYNLKLATRNTVIAVVATDAALNQAQATRMATAAQDGIARAVFPSHLPSDGDVVFAAATGAVPVRDPISTMTQLCHAGALCLSRAIARGVFAARPAEGDLFPCWSDKFAGIVG